MPRSLIFLAAAVAFAATPVTTRSQSSVSASASAGASVAAGELRPGDLIRLRIWREPDLSGDFPVDESGSVTFPKLGQYSVGDESPESLKVKLLRDYAVYLRNPSVEITVLRRINILGAVAKPGLYPVDPTMTIADAVAAAGGATPLGDPEKVDLLRDGSRTTEHITSVTRIADTSLRSGDQIYVPERSWAVRNTAFVTTGASIAASLIMAVILRR